MYFFGFSNEYGKEKIISYYLLLLVEEVYTNAGIDSCCRKGKPVEALY